ncbi:MAG: DUF2147 domain-containing protein [Crocinitomicaceae bacterium]|nr:DUF2147 domain-containing protein [Crocinitomicaceae bacterium]MDG1777128.1 DUF2147 domain-containing protein [Crocinitomicaceae bacterium]
MKLALGVFAVLFSLNTMAQSCVGKWVTIDDETNKKKSIVNLYKEDGKLYGKILYLFPREGREDDPKCDKCDDDRKDQPIVGMQIVRNLDWDGSVWKNGTIVDPKIGKVYNLKMWLNPKNKKELNVRGFVGPFYRTQTWVRLK